MGDTTLYIPVGPIFGPSTVADLDDENGTKDVLRLLRANQDEQHGYQVGLPSPTFDHASA